MTEEVITYDKIKTSFKHAITHAFIFVKDQIDSDEFPTLGQDYLTLNEAINVFLKKLKEFKTGE